MRFAIVDGQRSAALPGLTGFCPACGGPVIAKCGSQRIAHWAHRGKRSCDHWWEPETEWHRLWKSHFPKECQEVVLQDSSGEKHIADVRTAQGLTIEFQHSHIRPEERAAREKFYGEMIWVVDALRLQRDLPRFREGARGLRPVVAPGIYLHLSPEDLFPSHWLNSKAPVFFDFAGPSKLADSRTPIERSLWCLLPRTGQQAIVLKISRETFSRTACEKSKLLLFRSVPARVNQWLAVEQAKRARQLLRYHSAPFHKAPRRRRRYSRRWRKFAD